MQCTRKFEILIVNESKIMAFAISQKMQKKENKKKSVHPDKYKGINMI